VAEQVVGVLDVQADKVFGLDESDANLLRSLADQLAVAIRNARLFEEVETALAEARALQERYDQQAWQKVKATTTKGQYLYVDPGITLDKREQEAMAEAEQQALVKNAPIVIKNEGSEAESLIACINLRNKTIGALQLQPKEQRQWTDDDMALVEAITDQLSQTAENLRLFEEAQDRAGREQTIREITDKLKTAPNLDVLLETAARELGLRLGARHTVLEMGTERETNGAERHEGPVETGQVETSQAETGQQE
jgi:GAF domain-containing protein